MEMTLISKKIDNRDDYLQPIHPIRSIQKVKNLVVNFNEERATPILVGKHGCLLNGTHRYSAYLIRKKMGCEKNFRIVYLADLTCWVGDAIREYISEGGKVMFIDIDYFWDDNWTFSACYEDD